jgi:phenylalanyl-tRNA synthetase beta chain
MKFSYNWLRELVSGLDTPPEELMRLITLKTAECDRMEEVGAALGGASEAIVVSVEPMGASHNRKAVVETARYGTKTVVCGAPNLRVGMRTAYIGIGRKTIEGVESDGMLASAAELGIGSDHSGIVELLAPLALTPDYIIEVDNKSLTHRPDLWGHYGMAREISAITKNKLLDPVPPQPLPDSPAAVRVTVQDYALCPRYSALAFENVTVQPSPLWLQYRLESIGLNAINNIVDVTNLILAELPQPMHAFDLDKLHGAKLHGAKLHGADKLHGAEIIVRNAHAGEKLAALNGETYELDPSNLVIADAQCPIALAGVIGGAGSAISETTTRIVLESACFNAISVRKTSSKLKVRTDASMRFEKSQDPMNTMRGLKHALALLEEVSPGIRLVGGVADAWHRTPDPPPIELPLDWLDRKLGKAIPATEVRAILESLEFKVEQPSPRTLSVRVPSWRATKDVTIKDDLVEEVGRMIGYDSIVPTPPLSPARVPPPNPNRELHQIRKMAAAQGFTEVYNYSFVSEEQARAFELDPAEHVQVTNPIVSDQNFLRASLLPGIWKNIRDNARNFDSFRLFEIGREIHPDREVPHFVAAIYAKDDGPNSGKAGLLELKRLAECLLPGVTVWPHPARGYEHPQRTANLTWSGAGDGVNVGRLFEFHPKMIETGRAAVLDFDLTAIFDFQNDRLQSVRYQPLRRFPTSAFDITVAVPARTSIGEVQAAIPRAVETLSVEFLREFTLPDGRRSLSYRITAGAADRTLSSEEAGAIRASVIEALTRLGWESRS